MQLYLVGARRGTSGVVAFLRLAVVRGERGAGADAARLTAVRLAAGAAEVLHDRVQVGALALGCRRRGRAWRRWEASGCSAYERRHRHFVSVTASAARLDEKLSFVCLSDVSRIPVYRDTRATRSTVTKNQTTGRRSSRAPIYTVAFYNLSTYCMATVTSGTTGRTEGGEGGLVSPKPPKHLHFSYHRQKKMCFIADFGAKPCPRTF